MPRRRKGLGKAGSAAIVVLLAVAACAGDDDAPDVATPTDSRATETTDATGTSETTGTTAATGGPGSTDTTGAATPGEPETEAEDADTSLVALARGDSIGVWTTPNDGAGPDRTLRASDEPNAQIVMLVKQELGPMWLEVYLPTAPPGSSGWVKLSDVTLSRHRFRIEVSRSARTLTVHAGEVPALQTPVAIGPDAPQPAAGLYIKSLLEPANAGGPYGRYAYGLSGSASPTDAFESGSGLVAIHGTHDESTLGQDAGRGALAIGAEDLNRLVSSIGLPLGTPVEIVP
jgi:hypothetical protein